jgi:hypothetical protein
VSAPEAGKSAQAAISLGVFSAPDSRALRLLYAIDPFVSLQPGVKEAAFAAGDTPAVGVVRRR